MKVDKQIMSLFYRFIVESVMSYCIISWFGSSHKKDQHKLAKIGEIAKRKGVNNKDLNELYQNDCINMVDKILNDSLHPLYNCYAFLRSSTVETLIYDPPHERPPAIYDHISCNGW